MKQRRTFPRWVLTALAAVLVQVLFLTALSRVTAGDAEAQRQNLEDSLRRAAVACYAVEGHYPPTVEHLQTHYGIQVDTDRFVVHYTVFAENLMPDITVIAYE